MTLPAYVLPAYDTTGRQHLKKPAQEIEEQRQRERDQ